MKDLILASVYAPCILLLNGIECLGKDTESGKADHRVCNALQEAVDSLVGEKYPVVVVALTTVLPSVVSKLRSQFLHKVGRTQLYFLLVAFCIEIIISNYRLR